ncbi:helix-turn-helix domain-containing protein [uncultured Modestobacter sp.]|uniref:helix-turn-helix domain-containing protein n=1 Tax=uncultured Modestobacter sp. TaxID=380048 RepID=UPI00262AAF66|nr:helix-turn-helix domain-containing protein [uncultured Modestobacter sp.]
MSSLLDRPVMPDAGDITAAVAALPHVKDFLATHPGPEVVRLVVDDEHGDSLTVPRSAVELLARVLAHMAAGQGVSIVPSQAELTTQQAADMLNVSRPFLIGLLEQGVIDYRKVGTHRRILAASLLEYMRQDDRKRRGVADELTALAEEMDLR